MMMTGYVWDDLMELRKATVEFVMAWFVAHGEAEEDLELRLDEDGDGALHVGGYWSDAHPVVEFEDGIVARWYRSGYWD